MSKPSIHPDLLIHQLLRAHPELRAVLKELGIKPARDREKTLSEACAGVALEPRTTARVLEAARETMPQQPAVCLELMTPEELCKHLVQAQSSVRHELDRLNSLTRAAAEQYSAGSPKLLQVRKSFVALHRRLKAHLRYESKLLFPLIHRSMVGEVPVRRASLQTTLAGLDAEHNDVDEALAEMNVLVQDASPDSGRAGAMGTISEAIESLQRVLHEQIYKESHFLFPRIVALRGTA